MVANVNSEGRELFYRTYLNRFALFTSTQQQRGYAGAYYKPEKDLPDSLMQAPASGGTRFLRSFGKGHHRG